MVSGLTVVRGDIGDSEVHDKRSTSNLSEGIGDYISIIDTLLRALLWIEIELILWIVSGGPLL